MTNRAERWITFDCYGTLVDWQSGFRRILAEQVADDRVDALVAAYHVAELEVEAADPGLRYREVLRRSLALAGRMSGVPVADPGVLGEEWGRLTLFADTQPALRELRADGWRLGILTNCDDELWARTAGCFDPPIDVVVTAQQVGAYKPAPAHFEEFGRRTGATVETGWIHAAVSWYHDIRTAQSLRIPAVWVDRGLTGEDAAIAAAHVPDLASLPAAIRLVREQRRESGSQHP